MQYQDINTIIINNEGDCSAAEAHGVATGMLCVNDRTGAGFWLQEVLQNTDTMRTSDKALLEELFEVTRGLLLSDEFDFELLLPNDEAPLSMQVEALRKWCQGFLYGLGTASPREDWSQDIRDIVKDIAECTKLEADSEDEDAENDFMEITEYLRAAVIFLRTELNSSNRTVH